MSIVGGLDIHRKQLTYDWVDEQNGKWERGRITPADREHLASWLTRSDSTAQGPVAFALEGCTGWRYVAEEMQKAGVEPHLAEPADTSVLRGPKRRAKTDKADAKLRWRDFARVQVSTAFGTTSTKVRQSIDDHPVALWMKRVNDRMSHGKVAASRSSDLRKCG